jgi:hypothetical protein
MALVSLRLWPECANTGHCPTAKVELAAAFDEWFASAVKLQRFESSLWRPRPLETDEYASGNAGRILPGAQERRPKNPSNPLSETLRASQIRGNT